MRDIKHIEITKIKFLPNNNSVVKGADKTYVYEFNVYENNKVVLQDKTFIGVTCEFIGEWNRRLNLGHVKQTIEEKLESYLLPFVKAHFEDFKNSDFKRTLLKKSKDLQI